MTSSIRRSLFRFAMCPFLLAMATVPTVSPQALAATTGSRPPAASLSSLVLSAGDVRSAYGSGLRQVLSKVMDNRLAILTFGAIGSDMAVTASGRVTGYETVFYRSPHGIYNVVSSVNVYKAPSYAQAVITNALRTGAKPIAGLTIKVSSTSGVGSAALLETKQSSAAGLYTLLIGFQRGKYTAAVDVGSSASKPTMSTVLGLAKLIDGRIQAHG
jgi:hypothetical protein